MQSPLNVDPTKVHAGLLEYDRGLCPDTYHTPLAPHLPQPTSTAAAATQLRGGAWLLPRLCRHVDGARSSPHTRVWRVPQRWASKAGTAPASRQRNGRVGGTALNGLCSDGRHGVPPVRCRATGCLLACAHAPACVLACGRGGVGGGRWVGGADGDPSCLRCRHRAYTVLRLPPSCSPLASCQMAAPAGAPGAEACTPCGMGMRASSCL